MKDYQIMKLIRTKDNSFDRRYTKTPEAHLKAKKLRDAGFTYTEIGEILNISFQTARLWCNPQAREKAREASRKSFKNYYYALTPDQRREMTNKKRESCLKYKKELLETKINNINNKIDMGV